MSEDIEMHEEIIFPFDEPNNLGDERGRIWKLGHDGFTMKLTQQEYDNYEAIREVEQRVSEEKFGENHFAYCHYFERNKFAIDYIVNEEDFDLTEKFRRLIDYAVKIESELAGIIEFKKENKDMEIKLHHKYLDEYYTMHGRKVPQLPDDFVEDFMDRDFQDKFKNEFDEFKRSKSDYLHYSTMVSIAELNFASCTKSKFYINEIINKLKETPKPKRKKSSNSTNLGLFPTVLLFDLLIRENAILEHQSNCSEAIEILTGYSSKQSSNAFGKIKKPDTRKLYKEDVKKLLETILKKLEN